MRTRREAADRAAVDAVQHGVVDAITGGGRRRVRAVSLGVARGAHVRRVVAELLSVGALNRHVRLREVVRADQLVVAGERRPEMGDVRAVTEVAVVERQRVRRSRQAPVDEVGALRPDAGVDHADDDVRAGVVLPAQRRPDVGRAEEAGVVVLRLVERVLLHGEDARNREQPRDLVRRHAGGDAAVGDRERGAELGSVHCALDRKVDPLDLGIGKALVALDRQGVLRERLVRHARARGLEALDPACIRRSRRHGVLDHHRHELRPRQPEQRGIRLRDAPVRMLGSDVRRRLCRLLLRSRQSGRGSRSDADCDEAQ